MTEFKRDLASSNHQARGITVHGDPRAAQKQQLVEMTSQLVKGVGSGYAVGKGEEQLGVEETQEQADAFVAEAFRAPHSKLGDVVHTGGGETIPTSEPTKEQVSEQRAAFLSKADLNDKRIQSALDQGRISSTEANNRRIQNRKEFASNPISALFIADYDRTVGGGSAGAARGAFFGKTTQEKAQEKILTARIVQADKDEQAAESISQKRNIPIEISRKLIADHKATQQEVLMLTEREKLGKLGASDAYRLHAGKTMPVYEQVTRELQKVITASEAGASAESANAFRTSLNLKESEILLQIEGSNMMPSVKDKEKERTKAIFTGIRDQLKDSSFTSSFTRLKEEKAAEIAHKVTFRQSQFIDSSPSILNAFAIGGEKNIVTMMDLMINAQSMADKFGIATNPMYGLLLNGPPEDTVAAIDGGMGKVIKGDGALEANESIAVALAQGKVGVPTLMAEALKANPEGVKEVLSQVKNLRLDVLANDKEIQSLAKSDPELIKVYMDTAARDVISTQIGSGGEVPEYVKITAPKRTQGRGKSGRRTGNRWILDGGGVPLGEGYKAQMIGMYKLAQKNPSMWNKDFSSIEQFVNSKFVLNGPVASEQDVIEEKVFEKKGIGRFPDRDPAVSGWTEEEKGDIRTTLEEEQEEFDKAMADIDLTPEQQRRVADAIDIFNIRGNRAPTRTRREVQAGFDKDEQERMDKVLEDLEKQYSDLK